LTVVFALAALAVVAGCGHDPVTPIRSSHFLPRTSPSNLLYNLQQVYKYRDSAELESLLADPDFVFALSPGDQQKPELPDDWGRDTEILLHRHMLGAQDVQQLRVNFHVGDVTWDSSRAMPTVLITRIDLYLYGATPAHPTQAKEYRVNLSDSRFWFRRNPWTTGAAHDSVWAIVRWEEISYCPVKSAGASGCTSWAEVKAVFR